MASGIYVFTVNRVGKDPDKAVYIGQSVDLEKRIQDHVRGIEGKIRKSSVRSSKELISEATLFGNYEFKILEEVSNTAELSAREHHWISYYQALHLIGKVILLNKNTAPGQKPSPENIFPLKFSN